MGDVCRMQQVLITKAGKRLVISENATNFWADAAYHILCSIGSYNCSPKTIFLNLGTLRPNSLNEKCVHNLIMISFSSMQIIFTIYYNGLSRYGLLSPLITSQISVSCNISASCSTNFNLCPISWTMYLTSAANSQFISTMSFISSVLGLGLRPRSQQSTIYKFYYSCKF